jgi:hypothetical protein
MIPLFAVIRISTTKHSSNGNPRRQDAPSRLRLWIPLFVVWLLLLPLVLVLLPLAALALLVIRVNPFRAVAVFWQTLAGLTGTLIEVNAPDALVYVRIF